MRTYFGMVLGCLLGCIALVEASWFQQETNSCSNDELMAMMRNTLKEFQQLRKELRTFVKATEWQGGLTLRKEDRHNDRTNQNIDQHRPQSLLSSYFSQASQQNEKVTNRRSYPDLPSSDPKSTQTNKEQPRNSIKFKLSERIRYTPEPPSSSTMYCIATAEPTVPLTSISRIVFRIKELEGTAAFGLCYANRLDKLWFRPYSSGIDKGYYLLQQDGQMHSDFFAEDNTEGWMTFKEGAEVSVEFNPFTGIITYASDGVEVQQKTAITPQSTQKLHFCSVFAPSTKIISLE